MRGLSVVNVSARAFSLRWERARGCARHYRVKLEPNQGKVTLLPVYGGYVQVSTLFNGTIK